ncbi:MAG: hypothetical protein CSB16_00660 [Clostridiales bacterium]|nr:MAG: hypothetical protein CSB16_00660 [Clostridiales bacterium]
MHIKKYVWLLVILIFSTVIVSCTPKTASKGDIMPEFKEVIESLYSKNETLKYTVDDENGEDVTSMFFADTEEYYNDSNWNEIKKYISENDLVINKETIGNDNKRIANSYKFKILQNSKNTEEVEIFSVLEGIVYYDENKKITDVDNAKLSNNRVNASCQIGNVSLTSSKVSDSKACFLVSFDLMKQNSNVLCDFPRYIHRLYVDIN